VTTAARRLAVLLGIVLVPLGLVGVYVAVTAAPDTTVFAAHRGIDSPALFVRFLALTGGLAATALAVAVAMSAVAASRKRAIVLGLVGLVVVVAGADLAVFRSLRAGGFTFPSRNGANGAVRLFARNRVR
jgi:hypothetical protein